MNGLAFGLGIVSWSLAEYCIHRWLGHDKRWVSNPFGTEHTTHHSRGNYFAPSWKKALYAAVATAVILGLAATLLPVYVALSYVGGFVGFYVTYEALHRLEYVTEGLGPYARWARRHHFHHHFHAPAKNHGVTSPIWDWVFGTYDRPKIIFVPEKLKMSWLCDPSNGEVYPHLQGRYQLRRSKSGANSTTNRCSLSPERLAVAPRS